MPENRLGKGYLRRGGDIRKSVFRLLAKAAETEVTEKKEGTGPYGLKTTRGVKKTGDA